MRRAELRRDFPALDTGPYPIDVQTDHEIWRSLPKDIRDATLEAITELEKKLSTAPKSSDEEREFHNELRAAMMVAVGVLEEAASGVTPIPLLTSKREGNA